MSGTAEETLGKMKNFNFLLKGAVLALTAIPLTASAWDFESGGIYYDVVSFTDLTCAVAQGPDGAYTGNVVIPATTIYNSRELKVVGINDKAFYYSKIENVSGGENVEYIGDYAFNWSTVENVSLGKNLKTIGEFAFSNCTKLLKFDCPEALETIGHYAFQSCSALLQVTFNEGVKSIGNNAFSHSEITSAVLPKSVTEIDSYAFYNCKSLEQVTLPESIETINYQVFYGCSKLQSITIPSSVKTIGDYAFAYSGLLELKGGECVKTIGVYAFMDCNALTSVDLGVNLKTIENDAFKNCGAIKTINSYAPAAPEMKSPWDPKVYINSTLNLMEGCKAAYVNNTNWVEFWNVQDNIPNDLSIFSFQVTAALGENGKVLINGEDKTKWYAIGGSDLTLTFIPDFGYKVEQVIVNNTDKTSEVSDNTLTIKGVSEAIYVTVTYSQMKVALSVATADSGTVTTDVNYGSQHTFSITPAEGWAVHSVMFNNEDVTRQVEDNVYTTPAITAPSEIRVIFEDKGHNGVRAVDTRHISLTAKGETVEIIGASDDDEVRVYALNGALVLNTTDKVFSLPGGAAYIINVATRSFKVIL